MTAGVHADEYSGIEAAIKTSKEVHPKNLRGTVVVIPIVNWPGFYTRTLGVCPLDGVEIFRSFPGDPKRSISHVIAHRVFNDIILQSDFAIDLHGGEIVESLTNPVCWYCNSGSENVRRTSKELATVFGLPNIMDSSVVMVGDDKWIGPSGTMMCEASARGVPTIIAEAGGEGKIDEKSVKSLSDGIRNVLVHFGMLEGERNLTKPTELSGLTIMLAETQGIFYSQIRPSEVVSEGKLLGEIRDISGHVLAQVVSPFSGVVHIRTINPVVREGDLLVALARMQ